MCQDNQGAWRRVYKSLLVLDHLIKNGSERVVNSAKDHMYDLRSLQHYQCIDNKGKDQGLNIRHRAKEIITMLSDDDNIREARLTAKKNAQKFSGSGGSVSNYGGGSYGGGMGSYGGQSSYDSPSGGNYDSYETGRGGFSDNPRSGSSSNNKKSGSAGLGGWDGNEDDDGTGGAVSNTNQSSSNNNNSNAFDADFNWESAPSAPVSNAPRKPSFDEASENHIPSTTPKQKSVPRKLVSLGAAANYSGSGTAGNTASNTPQSNVDLLGGLMGSAEPVAAATNNNSSSAGGWDPFAGSGSNAPTASAPVNKAPANNDPFSDFFGSNNASTKPAATPSAAPVQNNSLNDFFGSGAQTQPAISTMQPTQSNKPKNNNLNDLFGSLSTGPITPASNNTKINTASSNISNKISSSSTWAGIDNLDSLVNMGGSSAKPKQSMNSIGFGWFIHNFVNEYLEVT